MGIFGSRHHHEQHLETAASHGGVYGSEEYAGAWSNPEHERFMRIARPELFEPSVPQPSAPRIRPAAADERSRNPLRPQTLDDVIGQPMAKRTLQRVMDRTVQRGDPLPHTLLVGAAGTGKSTLSHVLANELGCDVYTVAAPVDVDTLLELREAMLPHDILQIEEIHLQSWGDRRGRSSDTAPEVLYSILEDRVIQTQDGPLPYPAITVIGTTTDEGQLPDAFIRRFPLRPHLEPYTYSDMEKIAQMNAEKLEIEITRAAIRMFGRASRFLPWQVNTFMTSAVYFAPDDKVTAPVARDVLKSMFIEPDGLTGQMADMLRFLYLRGKQTMADGSVRYQASVQSVATALGMSRDLKAVYLRLEPWLIGQGYIQVLPQGRRLTDAGIKRAKELV